MDSASPSLMNISRALCPRIISAALNVFLGLYAPGKKTNSTQLVIRLTPIPAADPNAGAASASSPRTSRPLTLDEAEPYGVYFFQSSMLRVLTREGICPKKKSQQGRSSLLKVQPTDCPYPFGSSCRFGSKSSIRLTNVFSGWLG